MTEIFENFFVGAFYMKYSFRISVCNTFMCLEHSFLVLMVNL